MRRGWYRTLIVETTGGARELAAVRRLLGTYDIEIRDLDIKEGDQPNRTRLELQVKLLTDEPREEIIEQLRRLEHTTGAHWL